MLAMYVDDMLIGGPGPTLQSELDALDRAKQKDKEIGFDIGAVGPLTRYLGCDYRRERHGNGTVTVTVSQRVYIVTLVGTFLERAGKTQLRRVNTPLPKEQPPPDDYEIEGRLGKHAPEVIGALLWVARCARPDISFAVAYIARFSAPGRWSIVADRYLERIVAYLRATKDFVLTQWLIPGDELEILTYADADHAGCPFTGRSTSGACTYIVGRGGTQALVSWSSHRQGCSEASTGEAEVAAIAEACRKSTLPLTDMVTQTLGKPTPSTLLTDSSAALAAVEKGTSSTMRYLRKNQRVSLSCMRDYFETAGIVPKKVDGEDNISDIFTKALEGSRFEALRLALGVMHADLVTTSPPLLSGTTAA